MTEPEWPAPGSRSRWWSLATIIAVLAVGASFNGLRNDFTYDDKFIVVTNELVHEAKRSWGLFFLPYWPIRLGGDGYRPLTLFAFAMEWAIAPGSAMFFHAVSIALYALSAVAVYWLASLLIDAPYAWLTAAFFAVHPVHVEAVANVVGQSEIWVGLLLVSATAFYIQSRRDSALGVGRKAIVAAMYFAACLFKEHAVVLPAVLLAAEALVIGDRTPMSQRLRALRPFYLFLLLVGCFYVSFRYLVIHKDAGGFSLWIPFVSLRVSYANRVLTMVQMVPQWLRLFLWPANLSSEYGPPQYPIANGLDVTQLSGVLMLIGVLGLAIATIRRAPVVTFGIAWLVITLLPSSNFILASGILIAERTLFTPSVGAILVVCAGLPWIKQHAASSVSRTFLLIGVQALLVAGLAKSIIRTAVWRDNLALFSAAVRDHPNMYRAHYMLGTWMMAKKNYAIGEREYLTAMSLFPDDPFVAYNLGQEYSQAGLYERAYGMFARADRIMPGFQDTEARMALVRAIQGRYSEASALAFRAIRDGVGDLPMLQSIITAAKLDEKSRKRLAGTIAAHPATVIAR